LQGIIAYPAIEIQGHDNPSPPRQPEADPSFAGRGGGQP
jgi:hypothetical protein